MGLPAQRMQELLECAAAGARGQQRQCGVDGRRREGEVHVTASGSGGEALGQAERERHQAGVLRRLHAMANTITARGL